jgi:hypothetical protein
MMSSMLDRPPTAPLVLLRRHAYATAFAGLVVLFLAIFVLVDHLDLPLLADTRPGLTAG